MHRFASLSLLAALGVALTNPIPVVRGQEERQRPGVLPGDGLLFNGWGVTPAGEQTRISDLAAEMVVAPDGKCLVAVTGGFEQPGADAHRHGGKASDAVPSDGQGVERAGLQQRRPADLRLGGRPGGRARFPLRQRCRGRRSDREARPEGVAGVHGADRRPSDYGPAVRVQRGQPGSVGARRRDPGTEGQGDRRPLPAFLRDGRRPEAPVRQQLGRPQPEHRRHRRVRDITVGLRPNDMALAPDGRLFVACAGDNTVHVIQTGSPEKAAGGRRARCGGCGTGRAGHLDVDLPAVPEGARPTPWPSPPTARRCSSPTRTTTT